MNRIALLAVLLLATTAQAAGPSVADAGGVDAAIQARQSQIVVVSSHLDAADSELGALNTQLHQTWAEARALRAELETLRESGHASSAAGQAQAALLEADLDAVKDSIIELQWARAMSRDKRQALRGERRDLGREIAALNRSKNDHSGTSYMARGADAPKASAANAAPRK